MTQLSIETIGKIKDIVVDIEKLNSYGLSMTELRDAVVAENVEIPGGTVVFTQPIAARR